MRQSLTLLLTILLCTSYGQSFDYPLIKPAGTKISDFVPTGWTILDSAYGDLNKDGLKDVAIIIQHKDSILLTNDLSNTEMTKPRILLVLSQLPARKGFKLIEQSNSFILKHDNPAMDDPYQQISIENGYLEIKFHLFYNIGSWYITNTAYKFRFQQGQFVLIGAEHSSFHRATQDYSTYSYNFLTKKRKRTSGNDENGSSTTTWSSLNIPELKTLNTFTKPFTWEVEKGVYL